MHRLAYMNHIRTWLYKLTHLRRRYHLMAVAILLIAGYVAVFMVPRSLSVGYVEETCVSRLVLLPSLQRSSGDTRAFTVQHRDFLSIGAVKLAATSVCFKPQSAPQQGEYTVGTRFLGLRPFQLSYRLAMPRPPLVRAQAAAQVALSRPISFSIDQPDEVFEYVIATASASQSCAELGRSVVCRIDKLNLQQGQHQTLTLVRSFGRSASRAVAQKEVTVLPAIKVLETSVADGQTLYKTIDELIIRTDSELDGAEAELRATDGTGQPIAAKLNLEGTAIRLKTAQVLPYKRSYQLTLKKAVSKEGAALAGAYSLRFNMSGGPAVTGVNIGKTGVGPTARVVVSFDQNLDASQDISKLVTVSGSGAAVVRQANTAVVTLQDAPRCKEVTITVAKGVRGENGQVGDTAWSYTARIACGTSSIIGYSVKGRAIKAYYYGSGSTTILFTGGIHGSEPSGTYIMEDWASYLDTHADQIPADRQVVIVPNLNPDGIAANDRFNSRGVNLDRNFATGDWQADITTAGGFKAGGGGSSAESEPETKAIAALTRSLRPRLEVSYHARGSLVGANLCSGASDVARQYASTVGYQSMIDNAEELMGYSFTGEYEQWMCEKLGVPAVLIELPGYSGRYLNGHLAALWKMVRY